MNSGTGKDRAERTNATAADVTDPPDLGVTVFRRQLDHTQRIVGSAERQTGSAIAASWSRFGRRDHLRIARA